MIQGPYETSANRKEIKRYCNPLSLRCGNSQNSEVVTILLGDSPPVESLCCVFEQDNLSGSNQEDRKSSRYD